MIKYKKPDSLRALRRQFFNILDQKTGKEKQIIRNTIREIDKLTL